MAETRQEVFCTVSQTLPHPFLTPSATLGRASRLEFELTFSSCSRAMHTCLVRLSNLFNTLNAENNGSGAMVLAHSLRDNGTKKPLAILVTLDSLSASTLEELKVRPQVS